MVYEFEGRTEKEAIDAAVQQLHLERDRFDVEIVESSSGGLFRKGKVKIKVHTEDDTARDKFEPKASSGPHEVLNEAQIIEFVTLTLDKMGYANTVKTLFVEGEKLGLRIDSEFASIIIGKKGKNLDSLQLLTNAFASRISKSQVRVILDIENYRVRREESLVRLAYEVGEQVRKSRQSVLLEPMNPFERRIIHTTLNTVVDIETKSEGEGHIKQIRVHFKGRRP